MMSEGGVSDTRVNRELAGVRVTAESQATFSVLQDFVMQRQQQFQTLLQQLRSKNVDVRIFVGSAQQLEQMRAAQSLTGDDTAYVFIECSTQQGRTSLRLHNTVINCDDLEVASVFEAFATHFSQQQALTRREHRRPLIVELPDRQPPPVRVITEEDLLRTVLLLTFQQVRLFQAGGFGAWQTPMPDVVTFLTLRLLEPDLMPSVNRQLPALLPATAFIDDETQAPLQQQPGAGHTFFPEGDFNASAAQREMRRQQHAATVRPQQSMPFQAGMPNQALPIDRDVAWRNMTTPGVPHAGGGFWRPSGYVWYWLGCCPNYYYGRAQGFPYAKANELEQLIDNCRDSNYSQDSLDKVRTKTLEIMSILRGKPAFKDKLSDFEEWYEGTLLQILHDKRMEANYFAATADSWGSELPRVLGGWNAYYGHDAERDMRIQLRTGNVPQGYANEDLWIKLATEAQKNLKKLQAKRNKTTQDIKDIEFQKGLIKKAKKQLCYRTFDLLERGYLGDALKILDTKYNFGPIAEHKHIQKMRSFARFALHAQLVTHFSSLTMTLALREFGGSRPWVGKAVHTIMTIQRVVPNALAIALQMGHGACQSDPDQCLVSGRMSATNELTQAFNNPRSLAGIALYARLALEVMRHAPVDWALRMAGVEQSTRRTAQRMQSQLVSVGDGVLTLGFNATSIWHLVQFGVSSSFSPIALANLASSVSSVMDYLHNRRLAPWGFLPESPEYYAARGRTEFVGASAGMAVSLALATGGWTYPLLAAALSALSLYRSYSNGTQLEVGRYALQATLLNIQVMEQLRQQVAYLESIPYVYSNRAPGKERREKILAGMLIVLTPDRAEGQYRLYTRKSDANEVEMTIITEDLVIDELFEQGENRFVSDAGRKKLARLAKRYSLTHPIVKQYFDKTELRLCTAALTTQQAGDVKAAKSIIIERVQNHSGCRYRLHFFMVEDTECQIVQTIDLDDSSTLLQNLSWDTQGQADIPVDLLDDLKSYCLLAIVGNYLRRSRTAMASIVTEIFPGVRYSLQDDDVVNEARKMLLGHAVQTAMMEAMHEPQAEIPQPQDVVTVVPELDEHESWDEKVLALTPVVNEQQQVDQRQVTRKYLGGEYRIPLRFSGGLLRANLIALARQTVKAFSFDRSRVPDVNAFKVALQEYTDYLRTETAAEYQQEWKEIQAQLREVIGIYLQGLIQLAHLSFQSMQRYDDEQEYSEHLQKCRAHMLLCLQEISSDFVLCTWKEVLSTEDAFYCAAFLFSIGEDARARLFFTHVKEHLKDFLEDKESSVCERYVELLVKCFGVAEVVSVLDARNIKMRSAVVCRAVDAGKWPIVEAMGIDDLPVCVKTKVAYARGEIDYLAALDQLKAEQSRDNEHYWLFVFNLLSEAANSINVSHCEQETKLQHRICVARRFSFDQWLRYAKIDVIKDEKLLKVKEQVHQQFDHAVASEHPDASTDTLEQHTKTLLQQMADIETSRVDNTLLELLLGELSNAAMHFADSYVHYWPLVDANAVGSFYSVFGLTCQEAIDELKAAIAPSASRFNLLSSHQQRVDVLAILMESLSASSHYAHLFDPLATEDTRPPSTRAAAYLDTQRDLVYPAQVVMKALACLKRTNIQYVSMPENGASLRPAENCVIDAEYPTVMVLRRGSGECYKLATMVQGDIAELSEQEVQHVEREARVRHAANRGLPFFRDIERQEDQRSPVHALA